VISSDQRQVFNLSVVAQTPKFSNRALRLVGSDWQFSPIMKIKSAQFFTVTLGTGVALNGEGNQRPNLFRERAPMSPIIPLALRPRAWRGSAAQLSPLRRWARLAISASATSQAPGIFHFDLALARTFPVAERKTAGRRLQSSQSSQPLRTGRGDRGR
jgi:hypothetical protein